MQPLEPPDCFHLDAALGWLGLGNWQEANAELEKIAPSLRSHPDVLLAQAEAYNKAGQWDEAAELAQKVVVLLPKEAGVWILWAYATRRAAKGGGMAKAKAILLQARELFAREPMICYNLACYDCQTGQLQDARAWLRRAFALNKGEHLKRMAREDPDLEPLREELNDL